MSKQRVTLYLDSDLWREFRSACVRRGYSASQIVAAAVQEQMTAWMMEVLEDAHSDDPPKLKHKPKAT